MENQIARRVRIRLDKLGLTPHAADRNAGLKSGYTADLLAGRKDQPRPAHLKKLAEALQCDLDYLLLYQRAPRKDAFPEDGLPLVGICEPGAWREVGFKPAQGETSPLEADPRFPVENQGIYVVRGAGGEKIGFPDDTMIIGLDHEGMSAAQRPPRTGDILVVRQTKGEGLAETVLAKVTDVRGDVASIRRGDDRPMDEWEVVALALSAVRTLV